MGAGESSCSGAHPSRERWGPWASDRGGWGAQLEGGGCSWEVSWVKQSHHPARLAPRSGDTPRAPPGSICSRAPSSSGGHLEGQGDGDGEPCEVGECSRSLGASVHGTRPHFPEKMAFVGFKGDFRPTWVTLDTDDHKAKIFQVVPIPVVRKKKL